MPICILQQTVLASSGRCAVTYAQICSALQITALGNPKLLERVAAGLMAIRNLFSQFDEDMNNVITREEFIKVTLLLLFSLQP